MNKHDRENLLFIIQTYGKGEEAVSEWMDSISQEDLEYALELLMQYQTNKAHFDNIINSIFDK